MSSAPYNRSSNDNGSSDLNQLLGAMSVDDRYTHALSPVPSVGSGNNVSHLSGSGLATSQLSHHSQSVHSHSSHSAHSAGLPPPIVNQFGSDMYGIYSVPRGHSMMPIPGLNINMDGQPGPPPFSPIHPTQGYPYGGPGMGPEMMTPLPHVMQGQYEYSPNEMYGLQLGMPMMAPHQMPGMQQMHDQDGHGTAYGKVGGGGGGNGNTHQGGSATFSGSRGGRAATLRAQRQQGQRGGEHGQGGYGQQQQQQQHATTGGGRGERGVYRPPHMQRDRQHRGPYTPDSKYQGGREGAHGQGGQQTMYPSPEQEYWGTPGMYSDRSKMEVCPSSLFQLTCTALRDLDS